MKIKNTLFIACTVLALAGCSKVGSLFEDDTPTPLSGERISILDLQKTLKADTATEGQPSITVPQAWVNKAWPQTGGYPNHVMQNLALDKDTLNLAWKASIGSGSSKQLPLNARPVVVGNAVFTLDTSSKVSAFDINNGKRAWTTDVRKNDEEEDVIAGGISFGEDTLYVTNGYDELLALSGQTGDIKWRKRLPAPSRAAPTFLDGRVFVTTLDNRLMAFDSKTGSSLWEYTGVGEAAGLLGAPSPAADTSVVVPAFSSGEITALRVENGSVAWSDNLASVRQYGGGLESLSDIKAMPVLHQGLVIALSFSGKMAAIDEATGTRVWQREISGAETPWVAGDFLFLVSQENQLAALSIADGKILWVTNLPQYEDEKERKNPIRWMGPVMGSGKLILTGSNGDVMMVESTNGKVISQLKTGEKLFMSPILSGGMLFLLTNTGTLMAYR